MVSPLVERMGRDNAGGLKVVKLNVDEAPAISERYGIRGSPVLLLFRTGVKVHRPLGAVPQEQLRAWLEPHLEPAGERA